jgi:hypothetical protein
LMKLTVLQAWSPPSRSATMTSRLKTLRASDFEIDRRQSPRRRHSVALKLHMKSHMKSFSYTSSLSSLAVLTRRHLLGIILMRGTPVKS